MITIGICDDEAAYRDHIKTICSDYLTRQEQEFQFIEFSSGEEVLACQDTKMHLLFLDIEMPGIDGLEVMEKVRGNDMIWRIVFVTSHKELRWDTIDLKTLAFLEKPIDEVGVQTCLRTMIRENTENIDIFYKTADGCNSIKLDQIVFIQAKGNYVVICSKEKEITGYDSIKTMETQIAGTTMIRTHRSYLANLQHIRKMFWDEMQMTNGAIVPLGRKYIPDVKDAYFNFIKKVTIDRNK
ncbi:MAG: response regulator transcription factor [Lachnospiraceae bacterium]|nr:response regulator transcription factor [Lachnospiraceae bacterium]